jgi:hypothetical protein
MLRVTVEIVPYGCESLKKKLHKIEIINDGEGSHELGNYVFYFENEETGKRKKYTVKKHKRNDGCLELVRKGLEKYVQKDKSKLSRTNSIKSKI